MPEMIEISNRNTPHMEFSKLDPILHSPLRLAIMSLLVGQKEADFSSIREKTQSTPGNLSVQINKLKQAGYIEVSKTFRDNYPMTLVKLTSKGIAAFETYVLAMQSYMNPGLHPAG